MKYPKQRKAFNMKKLAVIALAVSLVSSVAYTQDKATVKAPEKNATEKTSAEGTNAASAKRAAAFSNKWTPDALRKSAKEMLEKAAAMEKEMKSKGENKDTNALIAATRKAADAKNKFADAIGTDKETSASEEFTTAMDALCELQDKQVAEEYKASNPPKTDPAKTGKQEEKKEQK